jgi:predicted GIY-YIG superfamily endonuclease
MNTTPKTIQIFLPSGDPRGIRIAEITTRIVQVIEVPRSLLPEFLKMDESGRVAVYFLFGGDDEERQVYIGQTGDLRGRLKNHNNEKDFWDRALVLVSRTESLTLTHAVFLEWLCIQNTREAGRYSDLNGNSGSRPHTPAPLEAECHEFFETGSTLLATLGFPLFRAITDASEGDEQRVYRFNYSDSNAKGLYTTEGFVVLSGSIGRKRVTASGETMGIPKWRERLLDAGVIHVDGEKIVFLKDHVFRTPSGAACALGGTSLSGWDHWKSEDGRSLHDIERASVEGEDGV